MDYVLDGQQRITSIFGVFQIELVSPVEDANWLPIYFDLLSEHTAQDSQFVALNSVVHGSGGGADALDNVGDPPS